MKTGKETSPQTGVKRRWRLASVLVSAFVIYGVIVIFNLFTKPAAELGVKNAELAPCPDSPNCVSSQAEPSDDTHYIQPLDIPADQKLSIRQVTDQLCELVDNMPRTNLITSTDDYLRFEFTSAIMRFVDDVEFYVTHDCIHVRSASRIGRSDLGANRKRIEKIRSAWERSLRR
jgi:uncharacterized protein (DUF1499 family)